MSEERQTLLNEYAVTSRALSEAVERLRHVNADPGVPGRELAGGLSAE